MGSDKIVMEDIILKVDYSSITAINRLINLLKSNNVKVKELSKDEYVIKL
mgnify:CR=1 FL=1